MMNKILQSFFALSLFVVFSYGHANAQQCFALFLGNSYTGNNSLPQLTSNFAAGAGRQLIVNSNTPGGSSFSTHSGNTVSQQLIAQGNWNYVVLQEQSQTPAFPMAQVEQQCFPYAATLNNQIKENNSCAQTVFYMTWGREEGDAQNCSTWPPVCTYEGMDDLLYERYMMMAEDNDALVSPVGRVWRYLRANHPEIDLYTEDGSHPSVAGSYSAACTFYTIFFHADPTESDYDATLDADVAETIRNAAKAVVYDELYKWIPGEMKEEVVISYSTNSALDYTLSATASGMTNPSFKWFFGFEELTGQTVNVTFPSSGEYLLTVSAFDGCVYSSTTLIIDAGSMAVHELEQSKALVYPNPSSGLIHLSELYQAGRDEVSIYDFTGRLVMKTVSDVIELPAGLYWIEENKVIVR